MLDAAGMRVVPCSTNCASVNEFNVYPAGAPVTPKTGWVAHAGASADAVKNPVGQAIVMKLTAAAHPPEDTSVTAGTAVVVVNLMTGDTAVVADRLVKGIDIDTAVTAVGTAPIVRVLVQVLV